MNTEYSRGRIYSFYDGEVDKYGFRDIYRRIVIPPVFDSIEQDGPSFWHVREGNFVGNVGRDGLFHPPISSRYTSNRSAQDAIHGLLLTRKWQNDEAQCIIYDLCGKEVLSCHDTNPPHIRIGREGNFTTITNLVPLWVSDRDWYIEPDGLVTSSPMDGSHRRWLSCDADGLGYVDESRRFVIRLPEEITKAREFSCGFAAVKCGAHWGYIDEGGTFSIAPQYLNCTDFEDDKAQALMLRPCVGLDLEGEEVVFDNAFLSLFPEWIRVEFKRCAELMSIKSLADTYRLQLRDKASLIDSELYTYILDRKDELSLDLISDSGEDEADEVDEDDTDRLYAWEFLSHVLENLTEWSTIDKSGSPTHLPIGLCSKHYDDNRYWTVYDPDTRQYVVNYVDHDLNILQRLPYNEVRLYPDGSIMVEQDGKHGMIDETGNPIIPPVYDDLNDYSGIFPSEREKIIAKRYNASRGSEFFILNKSGDVVLGPTDERLFPVCPGIYRFGEYPYGYIREDGEILFMPGERPHIEELENGAYIFRNDNHAFGKDTRLMGIGRLQEIVIPPKYLDLREAGEGMLTAYREKDDPLHLSFGTDKFLIDREFKEFPLGPHRLDSDFSEGLAVIGDENGWPPHGYVDAKGKIVIPMVYQKAEPFSKGRACVQNEYGWGFINTEGEYVIPPLLDAICRDFEGDKAWVVYLGKMYQIDLQGRLYECGVKTGELPFLMPRMGKNKLWGYVDREGEFVIQPIYDSASQFNHDFCTVRLKGWIIELDWHGSVLWSSYNS